MEVLLEEARKLAEDGVKELILVAQETTVYGKDLYGKLNFISQTTDTGRNCTSER